MASDHKPRKRARLDVLLVERDLVPSRSRAQARILAGHGQVGITLDILPVRLQLVFVPQFIKQCV